jgi:hypothetical protein
MLRGMRLEIGKDRDQSKENLACRISNFGLVFYSY